MSISTDSLILDSVEVFASIASMSPKYPKYFFSSVLALKPMTVLRIGINHVHRVTKLFRTAPCGKHRMWINFLSRPLLCFLLLTIHAIPQHQSPPERSFTFRKHSDPRCHGEKAASE